MVLSREKESASLALLVTFSWGITSVQTRRYTSHDADISIGLDTFTSQPLIKMAKSYANTSGLEDKTFTLMVPTDIEPISLTTSGEKSADIRITVEEVVVSDPTSRFVIIDGNVRNIVRGLFGNSKACQLRCTSWKTTLSASASLRATTSCVHRFGDTYCQIDVPRFDMPVDVSGIGSDVTVKNAITLRNRINRNNTSIPEDWLYVNDWPASTAVSVGDVYYPTDITSNYILRCTTAGTTAGTEPTWAAGSNNDGTAVWEASTDPETGNYQVNIRSIVYGIVTDLNGINMQVLQTNLISGSVLTEVRTHRVPPAAWNNTQKTMRRRCIKDLGGCAAHNNRINFTAPGYVMPEIHPVTRI